MSKTWLITGISSGFGLEMTKQLLESGDTVVGTVRNTKNVEGLIKEYPETFDCHRTIFLSRNTAFSSVPAICSG